MKSLEQRFWAKVKKPIGFASIKGCYIWIGSRDGCKDKLRYGRIYTKDGPRMAHRVSWEIHTGKPVPSDMMVLHKCDNEPCVRFDHLFLGTGHDNMRDMVRKGRGKTFRGEEHSSCKLSKEDVIYIRSLPRTYNFRKELSIKYGVSMGYITYIRMRTCQSWKWI